MRHLAPLAVLTTITLGGALLWLGACACAPQGLQRALGLLFLLFLPASGWVAALRLPAAWVSVVLTVAFSLVIDTLVALLLSYFSRIDQLGSILILTAVAVVGQLCWWLVVSLERRLRAGGTIT